MQVIDFYFDYLSPFSYLFWRNLEKLQKNDGIKINYRPVLMGKIFNHWEIKGPALVEPKREFMLKKIYHHTNKNQIPFTPPATYPFNPLYSARLSTIAAADEDQH